MPASSGLPEERYESAPVCQLNRKSSAIGKLTATVNLGMFHVEHAYFNV
jgi:hypothetical protein